MFCTKKQQAVKINMSDFGCMKTERKSSGSRTWCGLVLPPLVGLWPAGVASGRGKALVLPNMVLETGYKPTYRKRQRESDITMRVAYLDFSLSLLFPVPFLFLEHKQVASVAALVLRDSLSIRRAMLSYMTASACSVIVGCIFLQR